MKRLALIACLLPCLALAQTAFVRTDTTVIRPGEQVQLTLGVDLPVAEVALTWPVIGDTLGQHIEVLRIGDTDTVGSAPDLGPGQWRLIRQIVLTSFDTGFWAIPPFRFELAGRALETGALLIEVRPSQLEPGAQLSNVSDIYEPPFNLLWWMLNNWLWIVAGLGVIVLAFVLVRRFRARERHAPMAGPTAPDVPVGERYIALLAQIDREKLWQQGEHKAYQSRVTDAVRGYIEERFRVPALERTTDELVSELKVSPLAPDQRSLVENMLRAADLVKFAKAIPGPLENEQLMQASVGFIRATAEQATPHHG